MSRTSRRSFAKSVAVASAAAPLMAAELLAQTPPAPPPVPPKVAPETPTEQKPEEKPRSPLGAALTGVVAASYGEHLTAGDLEKIGNDLNDVAPFVERFRKYELVNADEPDFTFIPLAERW